MIINRENYQTWVTDYYDGSLDAFQEEVLMDFLNRNPDLKSEFEDYPGLSLSPGDKEPFPGSGLLRSAGQLSNEQIEHFSIALSEDDLDAEQGKEIIELKKSDPRFREYINSYEKLKLKPGNIIYPDKKKLLKIPAGRKRIKLIMLSVSTAASIAILAGLFTLVHRESGDLNRQLTADSGQENRRLQEKVQDIPQRLPARTNINIAELLTTKEMANAGSPAATDRAAEAADARLQAATDRTAETVDARPPAETARTAETVDARFFAEQANDIISITPIAVKGNIRLDIRQTHFLLAETRAYPVPQETGHSNMSVREYLAYQFRKHILADEKPDAENLKAWEIADAGVRGLNKVLGWDMELKAGQNPEGRVNDISFTSQLIRFDHKTEKADNDL